MKKNIFAILPALLLTACANFFDSDNTPAPAPLTSIKSEANPHLLWSTRVGSGSNGDYLKLSPTITGNTIFTASTNGVVNAVNKTSGQRIWFVDTNVRLTSGPGVGNGIVVVGGQRGEVIALSQIDGHVLWSKSLPGEILASPAVANQVVIVKAVDGQVRAFSSANGNELWNYVQTEPNLILRGSSSPLIQNNAVFIGFANGHLGKFTLRSGQLDWIQAIAVPSGGFSVQRMVDIDADPVVYGHRIYVASYQGNIASLDWNSGNTLWSYQLASYNGMAAESKDVYITDATGNVWSFGANNGLVNWRQTNLTARQLTGPAIMGPYVVVADGEGYLHWLSKRDGHFAARVHVGNSIQASPIVENNIVYTLSNNGSLAAYTLGS